MTQISINDISSPVASVASVQHLHELREIKLFFFNFYYSYYSPVDHWQTFNRLQNCIYHCTQCERQGTSRNSINKAPLGT